MHIDFNPRPPRPPVPLPPGASIKSTNLPVGIVATTLQHRFMRYYDRSNGRRSDSVELDGRFLTQLQRDPELGPTQQKIIGRMERRANSVLNMLPCDETGTFTDAGYELMPTQPYSDMSWALGHYSLYWRASGRVGPRHCDVSVPECDGGTGSRAAYLIEIEWTVYDVFDFDWRIIFLFWKWLGTPFHVFAIWTTTHQGSLTTCRKAPPKPPPCQDGLTLTRTYEVLTCACREGSDQPDIGHAGAVDSAMGRLLQDAKEWCATGRCSEGECQPRFTQVSARVGKTRVVQREDGLKQCYTKVRVRAHFECVCGGPLDISFPHPTDH
jgi:hypothetical protein